jgi:hypothetical protein
VAGVLILAATGLFIVFGWLARWSGLNWLLPIMVGIEARLQPYSGRRDAWGLFLGWNGVIIPACMRARPQEGLRVF